MRIKPTLVVLALLLVPSDTWASDDEVRYLILGPDGARLGEGTTEAGRLFVPLGGAVRFACSGCGFKVTGITGAFTDKLTCTKKDPSCGNFETDKTPLPLMLSSGPNTPIEEAGQVVLTLGKADGSKGATVIIDFGAGERWWQVTDTFAYAVTRDSGNTPIAGAGVFVNIPSWALPKMRKLREQIRYSIVVHLLPPSRGQGAADLGISPIGFGLFGNRVVFGVGWNVSRRGTRPTSHNEYFYVGFSASQVLKIGK